MAEAIDIGMARWEPHPGDDPRFVTLAGRLVAAAAKLGGQREIVVVRIDNWFGSRWLGYGTPRYRIGSRPPGVRTVAKLREPACEIPPFHPHRVLSEARFELREDGVVLGPFEPRRPMHHVYVPERDMERRFALTCEPGIYAWCSGNTRENDRAALMVYTHSADSTTAWYAGFRNVDGWRVSQRVAIGAEEWRRLAEVGAITELA